MDSVTQFALGAALSEVTLGRKLGRLAPLIGGICGTLPDLDVFWDLGDPVSNFTYHRSVTHSVFVLAVAAPFIAEGLRLLFRRLHAGRGRWYLMVLAVLLTHPLLDCFTTYGTQILWPIDDTPVSWSTIFIIDPLYTLPLLVGVIAALIMKRTNSKRTAINATALVVSSLYLGWTVYAASLADVRARNAMAANGHGNADFFLVPGPFTSLLWRVTAVDEQAYHNLYFSLLDGDEAVDSFASHPRNMHLLSGLEAYWAVQRLQWFSHGIYTLALIGSDIAMTDLRMGLEPWYVFSFKVGTKGNPHARPLDPPERYGIQRDASQLAWVWQRLWDETTPPHP